ncbi:hypothetical protein D3C85_1157890 [compost metagenome]
MTLAALSVASRLLPPAFCASSDCSVTVCWDWARRFWLISVCRSWISCSRRAVRSTSRSFWLLPRSCSKPLPASSWRRSAVMALRAASSALNWLRCSGVRTLPASLPALSTALICWMRVWLLLISAWARSGRVCAVMLWVVASVRAFCSSFCWVLRSVSSCSSCGTCKLA